MTDLGSADAAIREVLDDLERSVEGVRFYRLDDAHRVVPCSAYDAMMFAADPNLGRVDYTEITPEVAVSTVFVGGFMVPLGSAGPFFETMIRGGPRNGYMTKYMTWEEAEEGHQIIVTMLGEIK